MENEFDDDETTAAHQKDFLDPHEDVVKEKKPFKKGKEGMVDSVLQKNLPKFEKAPIRQKINSLETAQNSS